MHVCTYVHTYIQMKIPGTFSKKKTEHMYVLQAHLYPFEL